MLPRETFQKKLSAASDAIIKGEEKESKNLLKDCMQFYSAQDKDTRKDLLSDLDACIAALKQERTNQSKQFTKDNPRETLPNSNSLFVSSEPFEKLMSNLQTLQAVELTLKSLKTSLNNTVEEKTAPSIHKRQ